MKSNAAFNIVPSATLKGCTKKEEGNGGERKGGLEKH